jgi:CBS domain-containing protein
MPHTAALDRLDRTRTFLSEVNPFHVLSEAHLDLAARSLTKSHHFQDMTLFVQNKTILNYAYIVFQGRLEQYILDGDTKLLRGFLQEKDLYGGLSILFNKGVSIRTVRTLEDVLLLRLPKEIFLQLCSNSTQFTRYFSDSFTQKLEDTPYLATIAQSARTTPDQAQVGFLNQPLSRILLKKNIVTCPAQSTVQAAAQHMTEYNQSALVVSDQEGKNLGLLTDHDLRQKVVAAGRSLSLPVHEVMSSPLITLSSDTLVFEAMLHMMQHGIKHLVVLDEGGLPHTMLNEQDFLMAQGRSPVFLMHEIHEASDIATLSTLYSHLPSLITSLLEQGAKAGHLNRIITAVADAILEKIMTMSLKETGPPPVPFAFMLLGSEGRREQTLKTDQDNAIVFQDVRDEEMDKTQAYFLDLARLVCARLNEVGYAFCEFDIMAQNPKWCQPLSQWTQNFQTWIRTAEPEALLQASIFFDFRLGYGDEALIQDLHNFLRKTLGGWVGFFRHLAENALHFKPPLDFFGNFALQSKGDKKNTLDIKSPMRLIVDFARLYALKHNIDHTNTFDRLQSMTEQGVLEKEDADELIQAYAVLMHTRLNHQAKCITELGISPNNDINPKLLTHIEQQMLKEAFKRIRMAQGKMRMELTYDTGI